MITAFILQGLLAGSNENALAKHQVTDLLAERKSNEEEIAYLRVSCSVPLRHSDCGCLDGIIAVVGCPP